MDPPKVVELVGLSEAGIFHGRKIMRLVDGTFSDEACLADGGYPVAGPAAVPFPCLRAVFATFFIAASQSCRLRIT
jgi:hypothetical protein